LHDPDRLRQAWLLHQQGRLDEAESIYREALTRDPGNGAALHMLGVLRAERRDFEAAGGLIQAAAKIETGNPFVHYNLGNVLRELGRHDEAVASYRRCLAIDPGNAAALNNCGAVLFALGRFEEAVAAYDRAIVLEPRKIEAHNNRGNALLALERNADAFASYKAALAIDPLHANAHFGCGRALMNLARKDEALSSFGRAMASEPSHVEARTSRADIFFELRRYEEALNECDRALAINPASATVHRKRGDILFMLGRGEESAAAYDKAFSIQPDPDGIEGARFLAKLYICDWSDFETERNRLESRVLRGRRSADPFPFLTAGTTPEAQSICARSYIAKTHPPKPDPLWNGERYRNAKIRVGYMSGEFRDQATAFLVADLLECHDRTAFELHAVSTGHDDNGTMRRRIRLAADAFSDLFGRSDREIAEHIRRAEIDILVDLNGFFGAARPGVLGCRPCPIQVNYLGWPGTLGASYMDYIFADRWVIPERDQRHYTEKVVYLPDSYQANDRKKVIAQPPSRQACGLPERSFVFCSFNNAYKITPQLFDVWMRLLRDTEGCVLWLLELDKAAKRNLLNEAGVRGIPADRIVFAPFVKLAEHLARGSHADLCLDTLPVNGHTTTSDSLWMGVPVLTCCGSIFAGRVAASLLSALGLPELITQSLEDYEALALKLGSDRELLAKLRARLASNRETEPLFDTPRLARNIESAYRQMMERQRLGLPAEGFSVGAA
jgi:predicted O-linked N-acetylglucosamine transferase (SPINDLY family)